MKHLAILLFSLSSLGLLGGTVQHTFSFGKPVVKTVGTYQTLQFDGTRLAGNPGEPALPWRELALILPPGEEAVSMTVTGEMLTPVEGSFGLYPQQDVRPLSEGPDGRFIRNESVYRSDAAYPGKSWSHLTTQYLNGYGFALSTLTPVVYHPASGRLSYYRKLTVTITTRPSAAAEKALLNLTPSASARQRVAAFAQNAPMMESYPTKSALKSPYSLLIITPSMYQTGFQPLINYYATTGITAQVKSTQEIGTTMSGADLAEKIRNYIVQEYQTNGIETVILGGDVALVPFRGFYCYVISGTGYEEYNIPSDLYFSGLDGNWNTNGDTKWGEPGEDDLLPEISVGRMSFSTPAEQGIHVNKSVSYQNNPVPGELTRPFLVGEHLYSDPMTFGQDYLELLVNDHTDNGYFTHGMNPAEQDISRLYDTLVAFPSNIYSWNVSTLLEEINDGKSFIHHSGHSNSDYMMRLSLWDITNANFSQVNGVIHNYTLMYTHGCICGAFDDEDCISEKSININNFLVAGVFNSRYGWFNQGQTEGPSAHIHREFVSALFNDTLSMQIREIGAAHSMSKIKSAPWIGLPGEFEPGAQRWCHYDCNVLGDAALRVWTDEPSTGISERQGSMPVSLSPNPNRGTATLTVQLPRSSDLTLTVTNTSGQVVYRNHYTGLHQGVQSVGFTLPETNPGVYFCNIETAGGTATAKMIVIN